MKKIRGHKMKIRVMKITISATYSPAIWITAFELQRAWKIEGVRFSSENV